ncbi:MAG: 23S rRNA (pseudouridine(1915)-N(3))-methyltransferase RlmH [Deltaproteobacteria bacterium]|nr:23S rRNA (pseudouridine(1915)-N(3))-methyltransferase RlmH [Deltaproteobacteria bacterium]
MLHVTILMVGKTREGFIQEGLAFYQKRLQPFLHLTLKSVREEKEAAGQTAAAVKLSEGERLRAQIPPRASAIALTPQGRQFSSEEFAAWLTQRELEARPITFLIGGHLGLDEPTLATAQELLALSRLTLTHELSRLVLLEQLYRAMTIKSGHPYHV